MVRRVLYMGENAPHAVTPTTRLIAEIRPGARHNTSAQRHTVATLQPSTPPKAKPTGQHPWPEKNSLPNSACSTSGRRTKSPRAKRLRLAWRA
jgi:hypothetical protein